MYGQYPYLPIGTENPTICAISAVIYNYNKYKDYHSVESSDWVLVVYSNFYTC